MNTGLLLALLTAFIALPLNWFVVLRLRTLSRKEPGLRVLRERTISALALALIGTVFAAVFLNNDLPAPPLDLGTTRIITRATVLFLSVASALYWLRLYKDK